MFCDVPAVETIRRHGATATKDGGPSIGEQRAAGSKRAVNALASHAAEHPACRAPNVQLDRNPARERIMMPARTKYAHIRLTQSDPPQKPEFRVPQPERYKAADGAAVAGALRLPARCPSCRHEPLIAVPRDELPIIAALSTSRHAVRALPRMACPGATRADPPATPKHRQPRGALATLIPPSELRTLIFRRMKNDNFKLHFRSRVGPGSPSPAAIGGLPRQWAARGVYNPRATRTIASRLFPSCPLDRLPGTVTAMQKPIARTARRLSPTDPTAPDRALHALTKQLRHPSVPRFPLISHSATPRRAPIGSPRTRVPSLSNVLQSGGATLNYIEGGAAGRDSDLLLPRFVVLSALSS